MWVNLTRYINAERKERLVKGYTKLDKLYG